MGYMRHHAIIVTSWSEEKLLPAHVKARELFASTRAEVSEVTPPGMNGYVSFFVAPDGSKEGWLDSDRGEHAREAFIAWLDSRRYEDGSSALDWAEVQFGDEGGDQRLLNASGLHVEAD